MPEPDTREFFRGDYQLAYTDPLSRQDADAQARFIADRLALQPGEAVLDTVCGHGRHAIRLAQMGFRVTGADRSDVEVARAREAARAAGVDVRFVECDMRELPFEAEFHAAYNFFTSFGYFEDEAEDLRALRAFRRALKADGRFLIETVNPLFLSARHQARDWTRGPDGTVAIFEHSWDVIAGVQRNSVTLVPPEGQPRTHDYLVRMYTPDALRRAFDACGFRVREGFGGIDASPLRHDSRRIILLADAI